MKIVIDISEGIYQQVLSNNFSGNILIFIKAVKNGIPLPKGHGRLIDADELKSMSYEVFVDTDNPNRADGLSACNGLVEDDIDLAETIIEGSDSE